MMIHIWTLSLTLAFSGLLAASPAFGADMGKARKVHKQAGDASYWKHQRRLEKRINEAALDAFMAGTDCGLAIHGGYGPICGHAVDQYTDAINRIADWRDEAQKLHPADAAFHEQWLRYIDCRREWLRRGKREAQLGQIHDSFGALDAAKASLEKQKECMGPALKMQERKKALGIKDEDFDP